MKWWMAQPLCSFSVFKERWVAPDGIGKLSMPHSSISDASFRLSRKKTIVMPLLALHDFLNRTVNEPSLAKHVAGVLVESDVGEQNATIFSPDVKFPQAEFDIMKQV
ncbi:hypothetical protein R1flu_003077 [Riccia fluitans]|uniref:Nicastrin small lobe domain-containing protein n=1 Tax=Riccia fluitans TaxID=41844 RepID=A0ABD1Y7Y7_9MARC